MDEARRLALLLRPVGLQHARLVLAHAARDLGNGLVDGGVHVLRRGVGLDDDVVRAEEDDFRDVPILLHVEKDLGLDDLGIVEVQAGHFLLGVVAHGLRDGDVATGDNDGQVDVGDLHVFCGLGLSQDLPDSAGKVPEDCGF